MMTMITLAPVFSGLSVVQKRVICLLKTNLSSKYSNAPVRLRINSKLEEIDDSNSCCASIELVEQQMVRVRRTPEF